MQSRFTVFPLRGAGIVSLALASSACRSEAAGDTTAKVEPASPVAASAGPVQDAMQAPSALQRQEAATVRADAAPNALSGLRPVEPVELIVAIRPDHFMAGGSLIGGSRNVKDLDELGALLQAHPPRNGRASVIDWKGDGDDPKYRDLRERTLRLLQAMGFAAVVL